MKRPIAFWIIVIFHVLSAILLLLGQTTALFAYEFAEKLGLQESIEEVTAFGIQMGKAFGASDTFVYIPLIIISLIGLFMRKRWALVVNAAVMGISMYWTVTMTALMIYARVVPGYTLQPGPDYVIFIGSFLIFGLWGLLYLVFRGDRLLR